MRLLAIVGNEKADRLARLTLKFVEIVNNKVNARDSFK